MATPRVYLAVDFGAESGRVVAGEFNGERLTLHEVHRFANNPVRVLGALHWDALGLFSELKRGAAQAAKRYGGSVVSLGVDTWGVDYGLIAADGRLLGSPFHYRDSRTDGMMEESFQRMPRREIYQATGIQFMFFNTLFQVLAEVLEDSPAIRLADRLLFMPDLFHYWLTGRKTNERTIASTSQLYDPNARGWSSSLIRALGLPSRIFGEIVSPGTVLGGLLREVANETGLGAISVVAPGSHDTASAVAAVPSDQGDYAYLSSGTWSLMGIESRTPIINDRSYQCGFTNEIGVCETVRVLKNISGLWLVQECRRTWAGLGGDLDYDGLTRLAEQARPFAAFVDPDDPVFAPPGDMPARISDFCMRTGQQAPQDRGSVIRSVLESLAFRYRSVLAMLEEIGSHPLPRLHIVGGGAKNRLLNQFAANAINRPVIAGPIEATSAGNILMQMIGMGDLGSLAEGRELVRKSLAVEIYEPADAQSWDKAYERYKKVEGSSH